MIRTYCDACEREIKHDAIRSRLCGKVKVGRINLGVSVMAEVREGQGIKVGNVCPICVAGAVMIVAGCEASNFSTSDDPKSVTTSWKMPYPLPSSSYKLADDEVS